MNTHAEDLENEDSDAQHGVGNEDDSLNSDADPAISKSVPDSARILRNPRALKYLSRILILAVVVLSVLAGVVWYALNEAKRIPDFYQAVLELDNTRAQIDGKNFERNLVRLQNSARRKNRGRSKLPKSKLMVGLHRI